MQALAVVQTIWGKGRVESRSLTAHSLKLSEAIAAHRTLLFSTVERQHQWVLQASAAQYLANNKQMHGAQVLQCSYTGATGFTLTTAARKMVLSASTAKNYFEFFFFTAQKNMTLATKFFFQKAIGNTYQNWYAMPGICSLENTMKLQA